MRKRELTPRKKLVLAIVVPLEVVSAIYAWRDLSQRGEGELRGTKRFWRALILMNPGNSIIYWLAGRRA